VFPRASSRRAKAGLEPRERRCVKRIPTRSRLSKGRAAQFLPELNPRADYLCYN
jgi:hypothetical protein